MTAKRYMPPWHAQPASVQYRDERRLSDAQIATLQDWVKQGMPEGDKSKMPKLPAFTDGWQLGTPDLILKMPTAYEVPAGGPDAFDPCLAGGDVVTRPPVVRFGAGGTELALEPLESG